VFSFTPRLLYPRAKSPVNHWISGWVGPRAGCLLTSCAYRDSSSILSYSFLTHPLLLFDTAVQYIAAISDCGKRNRSPRCVISSYLRVPFGPEDHRRPSLIRIGHVYLLFLNYRPTGTPIQWVPWPLSLGVKRQGREADHSPPSITEIKE